MGSDFTCLIGKLMLEIVIYAYSTCREVENVLALVENKLTMTDALVLAHLGGTASAALADISHDLNILRLPCTTPWARWQNGDGLSAALANKELINPCSP